jgi:hypothetical protein
MTKRRIIYLALAIIILGGLLWDVDEGSRASSSTPAALTSAPEARTASGQTSFGSASSPTERSPLADTLNSPAGDIRADLRVVAEIVAAFRTNFPQTGNPTGTNAEITAALTGRNPLHLALIPPDHGALNRAGELCDRWGTPFFFHAESATRMEIRSAGPDRKLWSEDDVTLAP